MRITFGDLHQFVLNFAPSAAPSYMEGCCSVVFLAFALQVHSVTNKNVNPSRFSLAFPNG